MAFKIAIVDNSYTFACNEFNQPDTSGLPAVVHVFMLSKVLDFFDTFLIIVRGKWCVRRLPMRAWAWPLLPAGCTLLNEQ